MSNLALRSLLSVYLLGVGLAHAADHVTPDSIAWSNSVEETTQAVLTAKSAVADREGCLKRDAFLHEQNTQLYQHQAIAEEEYRTSEWKVAHDRSDLELARQHVQELLIDQQLANLHLAYELGTITNISSLATVNVQLWQVRLQIAQLAVTLTTTDRTYRKYEYDLASHLVASHADSQSHLVDVANLYFASENAAALAQSQEKELEAALQRARALEALAKKQTHS